MWGGGLSCTALCLPMRWLNLLDVVLASLLRFWFWCYGVFLISLNNPKFDVSHKLKILIGIPLLNNPMTNLPKTTVGTASSLRKLSCKVWYPWSHLLDPKFPVGLLVNYISKYGHAIHYWKGLDMQIFGHHSLVDKFTSN